MSNDFIDALPPPRRSHAGDNPNWSAWLIVVGLILFAIAAWLMYHLFLIEVPRGHVAVLIK